MRFGLDKQVHGGERAGELRDRGDVARRDGYSLIEVTLTIALMSIVVLGVLAGVQGSIRASMTARHSAQIQTVLLNAADRVNRSPKGCGFTQGGTYVPHYEQYVMSAVKLQWGADYTGQVTVREQHFVPPPALPGNPNLDASGTWNDGACSLDVPQYGEVQLVTITITTPDQKASRTIEVVKSDV